MSSRPIFHVLTPNDLSNHFIQDLGSKKIKLDESVVKAWLTEVLDSVGLSTESVSQELMSKVSSKLDTMLQQSVSAAIEAQLPNLVATEVERVLAQRES